MDQPIKSRPFRPSAEACERCVFNTGPHADWCLQLMRERFEASKVFMRDDGVKYFDKF